jgi:putative ABC transport system ATP-binding protein
MLFLDRIDKVFNPGEPNEIHALSDVTLHMEHGEFVVVIGTNGSGKSTLLNAIGGTFLVDTGGIEINGIDVTDYPEHKRASLVGRVFQDPFSGTAPSMTLAENLALAIRRGLPRGLGRAVPSRLREELHDRLAGLGMGLEDRLDTRMNLLSGGQRQAVTLLMATWRKPSILLLDEHTASLDPRNAERVLQISEEIIKRDSITTILVTHSMRDAAHLGDRLLLMHRGEIIREFRGPEKQRLRPYELEKRFAEIRQSELLDESAAQLIETAYV